jgi:hypothetical protein
VARHLRPGEAVDKPARRRALPGFGTAYDRVEMYHINICDSLNRITETTCVDGAVSRLTPSNPKTPARDLISQTGPRTSDHKGWTGVSLVTRRQVHITRIWVIFIKVALRQKTAEHQKMEEAGPESQLRALKQPFRTCLRLDPINIRTRNRSQLMGVVISQPVTGRSCQA